MYSYIFISVLISILSGLFYQDVSNKSSPEKARPFPNASVTLNESWIKQREALNTEYLKSLDPERLLHNFRVNAGIPSNAEPLEGWEASNIGLRGHFASHYLSAVSVLIEKYKDSLFVQRLNYIIDELYECQQALGKGYLSAFPEHDFDMLETRFGSVWAPYYTYQKIMQDLPDTYTRTGNKKAYEMVTSMAAYVDIRMSKLDNETIEKILYTAVANPLNEPGAMNEVLYKLYKASKDPKYLALGKIFDRDWLLITLSKNEDIMSGLHSNTHLALVNGFAKRYSFTGEPVYHNAASNFWNMLTLHHTYANGSNSGPGPNVVTQTSLSAEHRGVPHHLSNTMTKETAESCVTHNTQNLTSTLFTWSADPEYAKAYIGTFYNSVLALQSARSGKVVYHLPLGSPRTKKYLKENDFRCCNGSSIGAFAQLNPGIYYHNDSTIWVNLYVPSKVNWKERGIEIVQTGNFPADPSIEFTISAERKSLLNLKLLVTSWTQNTEVFVNNEKKNIKIIPGSFISLNREWKNKDKVKLVFHYEFYIKTMPDDKNVIALFYGPVLFAFECKSELILKGNKDDILNNINVLDKEGNTFSLVNDGKEYLLRPLYNIEDQSYGVYAPIRNY